MDILNGNLSQLNNLEGSLSPDTKLTGELSIIDDTITGELSDNNSELSGTLSLIESSLNGEITIPPEVPVESYQGSYTAVSKPFKSTTLKTNGLRMTKDVTIAQIPYYETGNESGYTVYIGGE